jgi:hypothetical protein
MKRWLFLIGVLVLGACSEAVVQEPPVPEKDLTSIFSRPEAPPPPASPQPSTPNIPVIDDTINFNTIVRITCGSFVGTASIVGPNTIVSANHVVTNTPVCHVGGQPAPVAYRRPDQDFAVLYPALNHHARRIPINCNGAVTGETYFMVGYAHGDQLTLNLGVAMPGYENSKDYRSGQEFRHARVMRGKVHSGMSGGPVLNQRGEQIGTILATSIGRNQTLIREFKDTYLCEEKSPDQTPTP